MKTSFSKQRSQKIFYRLFLAAGIVLYAAVIICSFLAVKSLRSDYLALKNHDLSEDAALTIGYDDHIYASMGAGIEIESRDSKAAEHVTEFLAASLRSIDRRILSCGILYAMAIAAVLAYPLCRKCEGNRKRHVLIAALSVPVLFALFCAGILAMHAAFALPFYFPTGGTELTIIAVSLLAAAGGSCFLAWLLRMVRRQVLVAVIAVPAVIMLFIFGALFEGRLYCPPTVDSFDFLTEIDPHVLDEDYTGEVCYDDEKNVVVLNGTEYPPEQAENPDRLRGAGRVGAYVFEALSPYAGNGLFLMYEQFVGDGTAFELPPVLSALYIIKSLAFIVAPLCFKNKRDDAENADRQTAG